MYVKVKCGYDIICAVDPQKEKMIKRIQIKNFKCYGDPGVDFTLKRVNFIFGDNSAGKSTFLQMIRMVLNHDIGRISQDFARYVFRGDEEREIKMRITAVGRMEFGEDAVRSSIEKVHDDPLAVKMFGDPIQVNESCPVYEYRVSRTFRGDLQYIGWVSASEYLKGNRDRICKVGIDANNDSVFREAAHRWLPHVVHAEAARPTRILELTAPNPGSLGNYDPVGVTTEELEYVNRFFKALDVPYLCVDKLTLRDDLLGVAVKTQSVGAGIDGLYATAQKLFQWRNYREVSNTLGAPYISGHALLALEEPESHVNERQIAPLVEFILSEACSNDAGQVVVECHSELFLLKVIQLLRTKTTLIRPEDIQILYAVKKLIGTEILECHLDENGSIYDWPDERGFFPERDRVIFGD